MRAVCIPAVIGVGLSALPLGLAAQGRNLIDVEWTEIGGTPSVVSSSVFFPGLIAGDSSGYVVFDYDDYAVKAIDMGGELRWRFGERGRSPGQFASASDLGVGPAGDVWVTDRSSSRVTVLTAEGQLVRTIAVPGIERAQPTADGGFVALSTTESDFLVFRSPDGDVRRALQFPARFGDVASLARDGLVSVGPAPIESLAIVFLNASWWFGAGAAEGTDFNVHRGIEPITFPNVVSWTNAEGYDITRLDPQAAPAAFSVGQGGPLLYVFFLGWTEDAGALIDLYETATGEYMGSMRLPSVVQRASVIADGVVAAIIAEPVPHIKIWRWTAR